MEKETCFFCEADTDQEWDVCRICQASMNVVHTDMLVLWGPMYGEGMAWNFEKQLFTGQTRDGDTVEVAEREWEMMRLDYSHALLAPRGLLYLAQPRSVFYTLLQQEVKRCMADPDWWSSLWCPK